MNRILFSTTLLLTAGLYGQSAQAAPTYTSSNTVVSPIGEYPAYYPALSASVGFLVTNQFVDVSGAASSSYIPVSWAMVDTYLPLNGNFNSALADDECNGSKMELTDSKGTFHRNVNNGTTGVFSITLQIHENYSPQGFSAESSVTYSNGPSHLLINQNYFLVPAAT